MSTPQNNIMPNSSDEDHINLLQGPFHIIDGTSVTNVYINIFTGTVANTSAIFSNINQSTNASYSVKDGVVAVIIDGVAMKPFDFDNPSTDTNVIVCPLGGSLLYTISLLELVELYNSNKAVKGWASDSVDGSSM